jgi:hypothetical protein
MGYQLAHGFYSNVQTLQKTFLQYIIMCSII